MEHTEFTTKGPKKGASLVRLVAFLGFSMANWRAEFTLYIMGNDG